MASTSTTMSHESANNYVQKALNSLDSMYPEWKNPENNQATICIPDNFETVRRNIARRTSAKNRTAKVEYRCDEAEQKVFNALKNLDIGAVVVSNVDMKRDFCQKAEDIYEHYKSLVDKHNDSEKASITTMTSRKRKHQDLKTASISLDFESDFILFHPRMGVCCIEVKSGDSAGTIKKAQTQAYQVPLKLKLLFQAINEAECCEIPIHSVVIFPKDSITRNMEFRIRTLNPDAQIIGKEKCSYANSEHFRQFWLNLIDRSENDDLFTNERFQRFIAVLCCYRGTVCLNGTLNAVRVAELVQEQLLTPKMNPWKAAQLPSRREVNFGSIEFHQDIIFLTEEQQNVEMCSDRLQLIFGAPGTGKTLLLLLQALRAAQDAKSTGRVIVQCMPSYSKKFRNFFEVSESKFAPGRKPIVDNNNIDFEINDCDDIFTDEFGTGNEAVKFLEQRIKSRGKTVCVVTNDIYPNNYGMYQENFTSLKKEYTTHTLKIVMRGTLNIVNYWSKYVTGADFFVGHNIAGPEVKPPQKYATINETLQAVFDCVLKLLEKGALPKSIAVLTYFGEEAMMVQKYIEKESDKTIHVSGANEQTEGSNFVVVDGRENVLSHEWPFVIVCSLFCADIDVSFMLVACSRAIAQLTIIQRDYLPMQITIEKDISFHPKLPFSDFSVYKQAVEEAVKYYFNGSSETHNFVYNVHMCLTVLRLNIFPKSDEDSNPIFESCNSFTDVLELIMRDPTLMRRVADNFSAHYKNLFPEIQNINATVKVPYNFIECLLSNVHYSRDATSLRKIEIYKQFSSMLARRVCDTFSEIHELLENESLPKILSKKDDKDWHSLLDFMLLIFMCRKHYLRSTQGRITVGAQGVRTPRPTDRYSSISKV